MRTITAKFPSRCASCGGHIDRGDQILFDPATKKVWHTDTDCVPEDPDEKPDPRSESLADELGFS